MNIWVPRTKIIEPRSEIKLPGLKVAGWYRLRTTNRFSGEVVRDTGFFPNLITDVGLDAMASGITINQMQVGTGNNTPDVSDSALQTLVASTTNIQSTSTALNQTADRYSSIAQVYRFSAPGGAHNLTEIGVRENGGVLFSRALIVDGGGSPTTFPWAADEILDATYTLRRYPNLVDIDTTLTIGGAGAYDITCRPMEVDTWYSGLTSNTLNCSMAYSSSSDSYKGSRCYSGTLAAVTAAPSGSLTSFSSSEPSRSTAGYTNGTFTRTGTCTHGPSKSNGNINTINLGFHGGSFAFPYHEYQIGITSGGPLVKTNTQTLALYWQITWGRRP